MIRPPVFLLIHSPLVGGLTWTLVAHQMRQRGFEVLVPILHDSPNSTKPYWQQHAESVLRLFVDIPQDIPVVLIAHSGAGPLLPAIRQSIPNPVHAYVFVDAGIPVNVATRLDLMRLEDENWAKEFQTFLEGGGRFPNWTADDLKEIVPDDNLRMQLVAQLRPRGLEFFTEPIPVFDDWPDAPCFYVQCSESYEWDLAQARQRNWPTYKLEAGHFHMLVDSHAVTTIIMDVLHKLS